MATNNGQQIPKPAAGVVGAIDELTFHSRIVTTTSGTLSTAALTGTWAPGGQTIVKTATKTGRYTLTLPCAFERLLNVIATIIGVDDAIYGAATTGSDFFVRDDDVSRTKYKAGSSQDGTIELQFRRTDTNADAELPDGAQVMITVIVARGDAS